MTFFPTNDLKFIIQENISRRVHCVHKCYALLEVNKETPIRIKLLVLDQCMFTNFNVIENKMLRIEQDARILRVKSGTSNDLVYFELDRPDVASLIKERLFCFFKKLLKLNNDEAVVRNIFNICNALEITIHYSSLHAHHVAENNLENKIPRRNRVTNSEKSMIKYYVMNIGLSKSCIHDNLINDHLRFIITCWRLSNHSLKIETGRYAKPYIPERRTKSMLYLTVFNLMKYVEII